MISPFNEYILDTGLMNALCFWFLAAVVVGCGLGVVNTKKAFHSALCLVGTLLGVAGLYGLLNCPFLAGIQLLVYIGAIAMVIIFAIMLTHNMMVPDAKAFLFEAPVAATVSVVLLALLLAVIMQTSYYSDYRISALPPSAAACAKAPAGEIVDVEASQKPETDAVLLEAERPENVNNTAAIGMRLLKPYTLPFELASIMILAAMIGVIAVARKEEHCEEAAAQEDAPSESSEAQSHSTEEVSA